MQQLIGKELRLLPGSSIDVTVDGRSEKLRITANFQHGFKVDVLPEPTEDRSVVRIRVPDWVGRLYAYKLDSMGAGVRVGDWVRVKLPSGKPHYAKIVAFGRDGHDGPLKPAELVD